MLGSGDSAVVVIAAFLTFRNGFPDSRSRVGAIKYDLPPPVTSSSLSRGSADLVDRWASVINLVLLILVPEYSHGPGPVSPMLHAPKDAAALVCAAVVQYDTSEKNEPCCNSQWPRAAASAHIATFACCLPGTPLG